MKSIELRLSNVNVSLENFNLSHIESQAIVLRQEIFEKIIRQIFASIEKLAVKTKRCKCGSIPVKNGKEKRVISTIGGKVTYIRSRMTCRACGANYYPLDEALDIASGTKHSIRATEALLDLATDLPYAKTSRYADKLSFIEASAQTILDMARQEGAKLLEADELQRKAAFDTKAIFPAEAARKSLAIVQVDSTGINDRASGSWMDTKVGIIYSRSARISKQRNLILDKNIYATLDGIEKFKQNFYLSCHKMGVFGAATVIFVADGMPWIKRLQKEMFSQAIYLLDPWHLAKNISLAYGRQNTEIADTLTQLAYYGKAASLLENIKLDIARCRDPDKKEKLRSLYVYVRSNRDGIENYKKVGILGSGVVEKTVDILVARRFKLRGMSWFNKNAAKLLRLRLLKLNGEWDSYWEKRFNEKTITEF
jgi:hypothetical protein